ncbi:hypothetical protein [Pseudorhodobacter sp.]|uniref:hypothetical protein n=1 Tax=Pseudorhodobacter sp. TaxID=1934400 RepID=UPI002647AA27|nr:hypothetical protein [Pseudorhodobacter sp.]MDN5785722.1 hypothetical protein [Pseudorhodobacter sp.]
MSDQRTQREILTIAARALGRIDVQGLRGLTLISTEELEAMALALVILGLVAIQPGAQAPETLTYPPQKEA